MEKVTEAGKGEEMSANERRKRKGRERNGR